MPQVRAPKIISCLVSIFIGALLILHTPAAVPQAPALYSNAAPIFLPPVAYDSGGDSAESIAVADLNRDGKLDLVVANLCATTSSSNCAHGLVNGSVRVLLGDGDGTFQPLATYSSNGLQALSLAVADLNGDGKPDLIVANRYACANFCAHGSLVVRLGNGDGTFRPGVAYDSGGGGAWSVAVADVNGDGKPDLLVANGDNATASVLLGNGDGTFQSAVPYSLGGGGTLSLAVADVNGDGKPDILVADCPSRGCGSGTVDVLLGNGDGTFQAAASYNSGGAQPISLAVADVNGDGKLDVIVANYYPSNSIGVLLGNGDGTFQSAVTYGSGGLQPKSIVVADVNGDGKPDIVVANTAYTAAVLLGNGDGTFQPAVNYGSGGVYPLAIAQADLNADGKPDLIVGNTYGTGNTDGSVGVLLNNTPFCTNPPAITLSTTPTSLWPPNGRMAPVTVSGTITNRQTGCSITTAAYVVADEYGRVQPSGLLTLAPGGAYSFSVALQASRLGSDINGRLYTITVGASNNVGKTGSQSGTVIVPHDLGH